MNSIGTIRSPWSHSICDLCWKQRAEARSDAHSLNSLYPPVSTYSKKPNRLPESGRQIELCCFCRTLHNSGIYIREDPRAAECLCLGLHDSSITKAVNSVTGDKAYSILRSMLEIPKKRSCFTQDEIDAIHYLITIRETLHPTKKGT